MRKVLLAILLFTATLGSAVYLPSSAQAQTSCSLGLTLTENGQPISATSLSIADFSKYGLRAVVTSGCVTTHHVRYEYKIGSGNYQSMRADDQVIFDRLERNIAFGQPSANTYTYRVRKSSATSNPFGSLDNPVTQELSVVWVNSSTPPPTGNPGGVPREPTTPTNPEQPATGTTPPVDTTIKYTPPEIGFDQSLGSMFNPLSYERPEQIVVAIINILLGFAGILAVLFIIIGGFLMITSAGNENRIKQGKQTLIYAVAGLILTLLSFSIVALVQSIIN